MNLHASAACQLIDELWHVVMASWHHFYGTSIKHVYSRSYVRMPGGLLLNRLNPAAVDLYDTVRIKMLSSRTTTVMLKSGCGNVSPCESCGPPSNEAAGI